MKKDIKRKKMVNARRRDEKKMLSLTNQILLILLIQLLFGLIDKGLINFSRILSSML